MYMLNSTQGMPQNCKKPHFCPGTRLVWSEQHFVPSLIFSPKKKSPPDLDHDSKFRVYMSSKFKKTEKCSWSLIISDFNQKDDGFILMNPRKWLKFSISKTKLRRPEIMVAVMKLKAMFHANSTSSNSNGRSTIYSNQWLLTILNKTTKHQRCSKTLANRTLVNRSPRPSRRVTIKAWQKQRLAINESFGEACWSWPFRKLGSVPPSHCNSPQNRDFVIS